MEKQIRFTKENLIKEISRQTNNNVSNVKEIYNVLESIVFDILSSVNEDRDVEIRLFEGINLNGIYVPAKEKKNNLTGKTSLVESKIKPKFNITRSYCEKLNE